MRTINTTFNTFGASVLLLGYKGDSNATEILIDCAEALEEYEGTMAALSITSPNETLYPGDITMDDNGVVHWVVAERDCSKAGHGSARIDLVNDQNVVVASAEATTIIMKTRMQGIAPDQIADWTEAASVALQELRSALLDLYDGENIAQANEAARQLAESGRVSTEALRVSAENARETAETLRASAESGRASAETARVTAETSRASAEGARASAETARASAETARVTEFNTIRANAQAAMSYIGPSESSSTASAAHTKGTYFTYNGKLYQATTDIAAGDTITAGTNCAQVHGGAMGEVSDLKSAIQDMPYDIALLYGGIAQHTHNGVTFTPADNGSGCIVNGTASANAFDNVYANLFALPDGVKPGDKLRFFVTTTKKTTLRCVVMFFDSNGSEITPTNYISANREVTVPSNAVGMVVRIQVQRDAVMSNDNLTLKIFKNVYDADNWAEFKARIEPTITNGYVYSGASADAININGWLFCDGTTVSNCPGNAHAYWILTIKTGETSTTVMQVAVDWSTGQIYYRRAVSGVFTEWVNNPIVISGNYIKNELIYSGTDANDIDLNGWYYCNGESVSNCPNTSHAFWVLTLKAAEIGVTAKTRIQIAVDWSTFETYFRRADYSGVFTAWSKRNPLSIGTKYVAFGDSVTKGAVWTDSSIYTANVKYQIPTRIAKAIGMYDNYSNEAVGGTGYLNPGTDITITQRILNYDFSDVEVVTIAGGVNDKPAYQLGTRNATAGDGTICGAIKQIINHMATNYPRVQIIFIQPTPSGHLQDPWNGTLGGGWSLNDFNREVGELCENEHVSYVKLTDSVYCKQWDLFSGGSGTGSSPNYSHFKVEEDYGKFGDFVAGKVSAHFHGNN